MNDTSWNSCADCVSRRDFLGQVAIVAGALIATGCGAAADLTGVGSGALPGGTFAIKVADYPGLSTVGQPVEVKNASGASSGIAVVRTGTASFVALGMACTHEGTKVNIVNKIFDCPNHGARFSSTGAVTLGPATRALASRGAVYDASADTLTIS